MIGSIAIAILQGSQTASRRVDRPSFELLSISTLPQLPKTAKPEPRKSSSGFENCYLPGNPLTTGYPYIPSAEFGDKAEGQGESDPCAIGALLPLWIAFSFLQSPHR